MVKEKIRKLRMTEVLIHLGFLCLAVLSGYEFGMPGLIGTTAWWIRTLTQLHLHR